TRLHNGGCAANDSEGRTMGANSRRLHPSRGGRGLAEQDRGDDGTSFQTRLTLIEATLEKLVTGMEEIKRSKESGPKESELSESKSRGGEGGVLDSDSDAGKGFRPWQLGRNMCRLMRRVNLGKIRNLDASAIAGHLQHPLPETWDVEKGVCLDNPKLLRQAGKIPHPALRNLRAPSYLPASKMKRNKPVELKEIEAIKTPTTPDCSRFLRLWVRLTEGQRHSARSLYSGLCDVNIDYIEPIVGAYRNDPIVRKVLGCIDDESANPHEEIFFRALHEGLLLHIMHQCIP
ncbi:hypothetical protein FOZ63_015631, partial [Perkinsus olseni]